jgi:signal transduction histidine kinase
MTKVLLVEDSLPEAVLLRNALGRERVGAFSLTRVESAREAIAKLAGEPFDVILLDLSLPDSEGLATFERIRAAAPSVPVVVLTGLADETTAMAIVRRGAQDYLVKGKAGGPAIARALRYAVDRVAAEAARHLSEANYRTKLQRMASELSLTEERERQNLAIELHDNIGQLLSVAKIRLAEMVDSPAVPLKPNLQQVADLISESVRRVRSLTSQLSPPILREVGLEAALAGLADPMRHQFGYEVSLEDDGLPKPLDADVRGMLFRAVRELLVNVGKHAKASRVRIELRREGPRASITVADDGEGFDAAKALAGQSGFGLFSIRERLTYLRGEMVILSTLGQGTQVRLLVPLKPGGRGSDKAGRT